MPSLPAAQSPVLGVLILMSIKTTGPDSTPGLFVFLGFPSFLPASTGISCLLGSAKDCYSIQAEASVLPFSAGGAHI